MVTKYEKTIPQGTFSLVEENEPSSGEIYGRIRFYRVVTISSNTNSFGLRGVVLVRRNGEAWEIGMNHLNIEGIRKGSILPVPQFHQEGAVPDWRRYGEIPRKLPDCPMELVKDIWQGATADDRIDVQRWKQQKP